MRQAAQEPVMDTEDTKNNINISRAGFLTQLPKMRVCYLLTQRVTTPPPVIALVIRFLSFSDAT